MIVVRCPNRLLSVVHEGPWKEEKRSMPTFQNLPLAFHPVFHFAANAIKSMVYVVQAVGQRTSVVQMDNRGFVDNGQQGWKAFLYLPFLIFCPPKWTETPIGQFLGFYPQKKMIKYMCSLTSSETR